MRRLESTLVKTKTFKMFVMSLKCVLFMSIIAFLSQRKLCTYTYNHLHFVHVHVPAYVGVWARGGGGGGGGIEVGSCRTNQNGAATGLHPQDSSGSRASLW